MSREAKDNIIVTASAGTGKTYRLVSEYVDSGIHPRLILALTFTDKAAMEMKSRIAARDSSLERAMVGSNVTTYHSFCARVLRDFADRAGIDSRFVLLDTFEEQELSKKVARRIVLRNLETASTALFSLVARLQFEGSDDGKGVVGYLIRIREQLVESGVSPNSISCSQVAEPNKLSSSLEFQRVLADCAEAFAGYETSWSDLSQNTRTRLEMAKVAYDQICELFAGTMVESLEVKISSVFTTLRQQVSGRFGPDDMRKKLIGNLSRLGTVLCESFVALEERAFHDLLTQFWLELEAEKKRSMCLAFGDLLVLTRRLLREDLVVRKELKARFQLVLVDEYQDTSPIQEDIVALLSETLDEERPLQAFEKALGTLRLAPGKLFVVGDPKQSIYGFRGADVSLFHKMGDEILSQGGVQESLNTSRRSARSVVDLVNAVVPCDDQEKLVALREGFEVAGAVLRHPDDAESIAVEVVALLAAKSSIGGVHSFEPRDVAVLVRRVKKAGPILRALNAAGVPARIWGGEGFFERQEVVELASALMLTLQPDNSIALLTVMRSPLLRFPDYEWARLFELLKEAKVKWTLESVARALDQEVFNQAFCERFKKLHAILGKISAQAELISASEALDRLLQETDYCAELAYDPEANLSFANVQKLKGLLLMSKGDYVAQIDDLTQKIRSAPKEALGEEEVQSNAVRIMTIHQSKGLEFSVVFLADTAAGIPSDGSDVAFDPEIGLALSYRGRPIAVCAPTAKEWVSQFGTPIQRVRAKQREKNESELSRLLYVALTRARDLVYFADARSEDNEESADRGCTLRKLFLRSYDDSIETMRFLMPVIGTVANIVMPAKGGIHPLRQDWMPAYAGMTMPDAEPKLESPLARQLLFASDLLNVPMDLDNALRAKRLVFRANERFASNSASQTELGRLAHRLIRLASEQLSDRELEDGSNIRSVLEAGLRFEGRVTTTGEFDTLLRNCIVTLETVIWPLRKAGFHFEFEIPLQYEREDWVIKGFADAIAHRKDLICVVDFKSSTYAAKSEQTKLQLWAYCAAIRKRTSKRVYFASCVIGESSSIEFSPFTEVERSELELRAGELT